MHEKLFIKNRKGKKLSVLINYKNKNSKKPIIIILHGFSGCKEEKNLETIAKNLSRNNFLAIRFDFSGNNESEGTQKDYNFKNFIEDTQDIIKFAKKLNYSNTNKIGIFGHSMGAQITLLVCQKNKINALAVTCPFPSLIELPFIKNDLEEIKKQKYTIIENKLTKNKLKLSYSFFTNTKKYSLNKKSTNTKIPKLIIYGTTDTLVPKKISLDLIKLLPAPKKICKLKIGHDYKYHPKERKLVSEKVTDFFKKQLT